MATQSEINAALGLPPGINPDGSWNAQDYMARRTPGKVDTQAQVDAARASAQAELMRAPGQSVTDASGREVQLTSYRPGFDPSNITTQTYLGELEARGGMDTTSQLFKQTATPAQLAANASAYQVELARLQEIDRQAALAAEQDALKAPTGLLTGQVDQGANRGAASQAAPNPSALPNGFLEGLAAIPNVTDQQIVAAMKTANVSPKNLADALGIAEGEVAARVARTVPYGSTVQLGDTIVQPVYQVTGSGQDQQIGAIENVLTYRASDNKPGGGYTQYNPDGTFQRSGTQMQVNATKDFLKFALGAAALFGGAALAGLSPQSIAAIYGEGAMLGQGLTAAEAFAAGLTPAQAAAAGLTTAELAAAGYTTAQLATTAAPGLLTPATVNTAATALTASQIADAAKLGLTAAQYAGLLTSGGQTVAGLMQQQTSKEAADKARAMIETETAAAKQSAAFRPVGMTTRFGTSEFKLDPVTGQLVSAGYTASPGVLEAQNRLVALGNQGLAQAEAAQGQFAPLQTGAQRLFGLGNQYLAQSPEAVAQNYLNQQMALLQPGRELELANLQNKLQQQGRGGLAVAQGGTLGDTTPELQALFNARAQQEAQLAAQAQQAGQQQVAFGAGLLGTGAQTMGQYYAGQQAAYAPYTTALGQFTNLEQLAQQPLTMGANLAQQSAAAGANVARFGLLGAGQSVDLATGAAATRNPYASALYGVASNPMVGQALTGALSGVPPTTALSAPATTFGTGSYYGSQDLGLYL